MYANLTVEPKIQLNEASALMLSAQNAKHSVPFIGLHICSTPIEGLVISLLCLRHTHTGEP